MCLYHRWGLSREPPLLDFRTTAVETETLTCYLNFYITSSRCCERSVIENASSPSTQGTNGCICSDIHPPQKTELLFSFSLHSYLKWCVNRAHGIKNDVFISFPPHASGCRLEGERRPWTQEAGPHRGHGASAAAGPSNAHALLLRRWVQVTLLHWHAGRKLCKQSAWRAVEGAAGQSGAPRIGILTKRTS